MFEARLRVRSAWLGYIEKRVGFSGARGKLRHIQAQAENQLTDPVVVPLFGCSGAT
jgi:hypothetical protein